MILDYVVYFMISDPIFMVSMHVCMLSMVSDEFEA